MEGKFKGFEDFEGRYSISYEKGKGLALIKLSLNGKKLWEKRFDGHFSIIGVDRNNHLYLEGSLRKGDLNSVYKLNSKGDIIAQTRIPDPFPLLTPTESEEWEMHASEEYYYFFKLACSGDLYLIHQLTELPDATFTRWLKSGKYFIFKFETVK